MRESAGYVVSVVKSWQNWGNWNEAQRAVLEDIIYHLEQAERIQELEDHNKKITKHLEGMGRVTKRLREFEELYVRDPRGEEIRLLQKQNRRYREALEFYANKKTYRYYKESYIDLLKDGGYTARKALKSDKNI